MVDGMIYAPIVIPTLNRIEHLQRCISSLQRNPWAEYTPLIISVDYPPDDRYQEGYKRVCEYLDAGIDGFLNVEVIYQEKNLGAYENAEFLRKYVGKKYDRYIYTEDDNEFARNFIEFIDKGLEIFENDENIVAICSIGASGKEINNENVVLSQNFAAYGYGIWIKKENKYYELINRNYLENIAKNTKMIFRLIYRQPGLLLSLQSAIFQKERLYQLPNGEVPIIDETIKMYLITEQKYVLSPCTRKVRNWGYDGSGENCSKNDKYDATMLDIDQASYFEYKYTYPLMIRKMRGRFSPEVICRIIVALIKLWFWNAKVCKRKI